MLPKYFSKLASLSLKDLSSKKETQVPSGGILTCKNSTCGNMWNLSSKKKKKKKQKHEIYKHL